MRVIYDHQVFSLQNAGGAARYHYELIANLLPYPDVQIELLLGLHASIYPFSSLADARLRIFERTTALRPGAQRYAINEVISNIFASTRGKFDIYHPTLYRSMPFVHTRKVVVTHHDCTHEKYPQMFRNAALVVQNKHKLYEKADAIICVSESSRRDLIHYHGIDPDRAFVVYHGIKPIALSKEMITPVRTMERPYILFVGFRGTYKNFATLLAAYAHSGIASDYDLLTVGGGVFSTEELKNIESFDVLPNVINLQNVSDLHLSSIYREAALFVYPSLYEGFGFPPLEAMNVGCPVLVSSTSSLPEVCGNAAYYFNPEDLDDLTQTIVSVLNDNKSLPIMRARGYAQVSKYDWVQTAAKTYQIYSNVLNQ